MEGYIAGVLPRERHITKAHALILWFEENNFNQDDINYVIFDDDPSEGYAATYEYGIRDHFIQTSNKTGLVDADVEKAKEILAL